MLTEPLVTGFVEELAAGRGGLILDGAMGTLIEDEGVSIRNALWGSVALLTPEGQALTERLHRLYVEAGADVIMANSHNASLAHCQRFLLENPERVAPDPDSDAAAGSGVDAPGLLRRVNRAALDAARRGARAADNARPDPRAADPARADPRAAGGDRPNRRVAIAACVASPDTPYATRASLSPSEVADLLRPQVEVLLEGEPDLLIFEMCTTEADLVGVAELLGSLERAPEVGVGVGLVFGADGRLLGGLSVREAMAHLAPLRPASLFVQCTRWDLVERPLQDLVALAPRGCLVGAYGNDGRSWEGGRWVGDRVSPEVYAEAARGWWATGARVVGGCCGTTPKHIAALAERLEPLRREARALQRA